LRVLRTACGAFVRSKCLDRATKVPVEEILMEMEVSEDSGVNKVTLLPALCDAGSFLSFYSVNVWKLGSAV
jgi:hypothetical protein